MDLDFLNDIKEHSQHFDKKIDIASAVSCPKCNSFLIEEGTCTSCGLNLNYNPLGEPVGERSFYTIREGYWDSMNAFEREHLRFFKDESKFKHYINKIKLRYNDLLDYFYSEKSLQDQYRSLYLHELRDIVIELISCEVDEDEIWSPLNEKQNDINSGALSLYDQIKSAVTEHKREKRKLRKKNLLNYRLGGKISVATLFSSLMFMGILLSISLAYISYTKVIN